MSLVVQSQRCSSLQSVSIIYSVDWAMKEREKCMYNCKRERKREIISQIKLKKLSAIKPATLGKLSLTYYISYLYYCLLISQKVWGHSIVNKGSLSLWVAERQSNEIVMFMLIIMLNDVYLNWKRRGYLKLSLII